MSIENKSLSVGVTGFALSAVLATLVYKNKTEEQPQGIYIKEGNPVYNLSRLLSNVHRLHDFQYDSFEDAGTLTL